MGTPHNDVEASPDFPPPSGRSLREAVITALVLLGLIIVFNLLGPDGFIFLALAVVGVAMFELLDALTQKGRRPVIPWGVACVLAMMIVSYLERPALLLVVLATAMYGSFLLALRPNRGATPASDAAWTLLGVAWVGGGGAGAAAILTLGDSASYILSAYVLITALDDIGGYFVGTRFGRHKMAPSISPAKSWEGWVGGLIASLLGGLLFAGLLEELSLADGLALGALASVLAPVGDLVESMVKREIGIKDSGRLLPGHGGLLDRLDAIMFCAPAAYLYLHHIAGLG